MTNRRDIKSTKQQRNQNKQSKQSRNREKILTQIDKLDLSIINEQPTGPRLEDQVSKRGLSGNKAWCA